MRQIRHIIFCFLAITGLLSSTNALAGDPPAGKEIAVITGDTTEPDLKVSGDTTDPVQKTAVAVVAPENQTSIEPSESDTASEEDDVFASDFYTDFDTTSVHSEKFNALTFNDSVLIVLNDPGHGTYVHPVQGRPTSSFGFRKYRYHLGVDIDLEVGDSVASCFDGKVRIAQWSKSYGWVVVVRHENGLETYYAHLSKLTCKVGQDVKAGEIIGLGGNTGHSHGSHLHFETRFKGQPFDPNMIIDFNRKCLRGDTYYLSKSNFKYLSDTHSVKHYSKKKKKTWYTYYTPGGPDYATKAAKENMNSVPDPLPADAGTEPVQPDNSASSETGNEKNTPAPKKDVKSAPKSTSASQPKSTTTAKSGAVYYTVKKGDTLSAIAVRNGTSVDAICKLNNIKSTSILQIGQKLRIK